MITDLEKFWDGFDPEVIRGPQPAQFTVKFHLKGATTADREVSQVTRVVPIPSTVYLQAGHGGNLQVVGFTVSGIPHAGLGQGDFEQRAAVEVRKAVAAGRA